MMRRRQPAATWSAVAIDQIDRLMKQSNGGFGSYLLMHHEWARPDAVKRSYELIAQHVRPKFTGSARRQPRGQR